MNHVPEKSGAAGYRVEFHLLGLVLAVGSFLLISRWHGALDYARRGFFALGIVAVAGAVLARSLWRGDLVLWSSRALWLLLAFLGLGWASLFQASYRYDGAQIALHWTVAGLLAFVLVPLLRAQGRVESVFRLLALIGFGIAAVGLVQTHTAWNPFPLSAVGASVFGNPNWASSAVNLTVAPLGYLLLAARGAGRRLGLMLGLGALGGFLIHTHTRSVWLAVAVQALWLATGAWRAWRQPQVRQLITRSGLLALGGALGLALLLGATDRGGWRERAAPARAVGGGGEQAWELGSSAQSRLAAYENTLHLIAAYPAAGVGLFNYGVRLPETSPLNQERLFTGFFFGWSWAHSDWLQLWAELGLIFPVLVGTGMWVAFRRAREGRAEWTPGRVAAGLSGASCLGLAVDMVFSFPLYLTVSPLFLAVHFAVIEWQGLETGWRGSRWCPVGSQRPAALVVALLAGSLVAGLGLFAQRQFAAEEARIAMGVAEQNDELEQVLVLAPEVGRLMPPRKDWLVTHGAANLRLAVESARGRSDLEYRRTMLRQAVVSLESSLRYEPNLAYARYLLGMARAGLGDHATADREFTRALELLPGNADILWERIRTRVPLVRAEEAIADLRAFRRARPEATGRADRMLAPLLVQTACYAEAAEVLEQLQRTESLTTRDRELLGISLLHEPARAAEGAALLREYYENNPRPSAYDALGRRLLLEREGPSSGRSDQP